MANNIDAKEIGQRLIELRGDKSIADVSKATGITERALLSYEYGERIPRDEVKLRLAKYYNKTVQAIFFD